MMHQVSVSSITRRCLLSAPRLDVAHATRSACSRPCGSARLAPPSHRGRSDRPRILLRATDLEAADPAVESLTLAEQQRLKVSGQDGEVWDSCVELVRDATGMDHVESTRVVAKAFGWLTSGFWRQSKKDEVPSLDQVEDVLGLLVELNIVGDDLAKFLRTFPEVLASNADGLLRNNLVKFAKEYRMEGDVLTRALIRRPQVLGFYIDCEGNCVGECNRCWVRF